MTRNNSAINLPSVRIQPQPSTLHPKERTSHSPGINVTQREKHRNNNDFHPKESIYTNQSKPAFEKLKIITNVVSPTQTKSRNDRSFDNSQNISRIDRMESGQTSILQKP